MKNPTRRLHFWFLTILITCENAKGMTILEIMEGNPIDKFREALTSSPYVNSLLESELTVFAPSDEALLEYDGELDERHLLNHIVNVNMAVSNEEDPEVINVPSMLFGSPPLWITKSNGEVYVNGAKIIMYNLAATSNSGRNQKLQIIDRVLEPLIANDPSDSALLISLTVDKLLKKSEDFDTGSHSIKIFAEQVKKRNKMKAFEKAGQRTFFIPVDSAFENLSQELLEDTVISGHIVPNRILFTRPLLGQEQKTLAYDSNGIKATAVIQSLNLEENIYQVKSHIVQGTRKHGRGHVIANIVKGNIPVANGIVHLIDKPLIVIASPMAQYLQAEALKNGRLSKFARYISEMSPELFQQIADAKTGTIFAPSNEAFGNMKKNPIKATLSDSTLGPNIFGLHFINQRISSDDIRITQPQNEYGMFSTNCHYPEGTENTLWFYKNASTNTLIVNGIGVSAEVVERDIGATNGIIHVINKVLGIPSGTIYDKLSSDPMLSSAFTLGNQNHLNDRLKEENESYTYFVPTNRAFDKLKRTFLTTYKVLFMGDYNYMSGRLLERHLLVGEGLTTKEVLNRSENGSSVQMLRGVPAFRFERDEDRQVVLLWENLRAKVVRGNLKCTNGYVHIIDEVILKRRDIAVKQSGSTVISASTISILILFGSSIFF